MLKSRNLRSKESHQLPKLTQSILDDWFLYKTICELISLDTDIFEKLKVCPYKDKKYKIYQYNDDLEAKRLDTTEKLLSRWGNNGMKIKTFIEFLDDLQFERGLLLLKEHEAVYILIQPEKNVTIERGDTLKLSCAAKGFPYPDYTWYRVTLDHDKREIRTKLTRKHNDGILCIDLVNESHTGNYICVVENGVTTGEGKTIRKYSDFSSVYVIPRNPGREAPPAKADDRVAGNNQPLIGKPIFTLQPESEIMAKYHSDVFIKCDATHTKEYIWIKDEVLLPGAMGPSLQITNISMYNMGRYQCIARNEHGDTSSRICELKVSAYVTGEYLLPRILTHPTNQTVDIGTKVQLSVVADGGQPLEYNWYKDNRKLPYETNKKLKINVEDCGVSGVYRCHVSNKHGAEFSKPAEIKVGQSNTTYTAKDKVALIIGISQYKHHKSLHSVKNDVKEAISKFASLGFKVVSLLDLTLQEMLQAISLFSNLLNDGVYGVIYVAGHGFAYQGKHYFIPWDAPNQTKPNEALCIEDEEIEFQKRNPALLLFFVDICREECSHNSSDKEIDKHSKEYTFYLPQKGRPEKSKGNCAVFFASSAGEKAFAEDSFADKGKNDCSTCPWGIKSNRSIFSQYLMDVILKDQTIQELWNCFINNYKEKYQHKTYPQIPEIRMNLFTDRKLTDKIKFEGETAEMNSRMELWIKAHRLPPNVQFRLESLGSFGLNYSSIASNIMEVDFQPDFVPCVTEWQINYIEESVPKEITPIKYVVEHEEEDRQEYVTVRTPIKVRIANLQRLHGELSIQFVMKLKMILNDQEQALPCECPVTINLGTPLVANLNHMYRDVLEHTQKDPEEQEEGSTDSI